MAVTALVRQVAAELDAVTLFGGDGGSVHDVLRPPGSRLDPFDELAGMLFPQRIFFRMQQDVAGEFQRNHLVHVLHTGNDVFEVANPNIVC